jgi:hypothetical protein
VRVGWRLLIIRLVIERDPRVGECNEVHHQVTEIGTHTIRCSFVYESLPGLQCDGASAPVLSPLGSDTIKSGMPSIVTNFLVHYQMRVRALEQPFYRTPILATCPLSTVMLFVFVGWIGAFA